jgi:hypothetical protein
MNIKFILKIIGLSLCVSASASAEWYSTVEGKYKYSNNLNNGISNDTVDDSIFALSAVGGKYFQLNDHDKLSIQSQFNGEVYDRFKGMNNLDLGGSLALTRKWALGLYAPWTSLSFGGAYLDYNNQVRSGSKFHVQLSSGKRITERLSVWADLQFDKRFTDYNVIVDQGVSGSVYNLTNKSFKLNTLYLFDSGLFIKSSYQFRQGDVVTTTLKNNANPNIDAVTTAASLDATFGSQAEAYRLTGTTHILNAGVSKVIMPHWLMSVEYQYVMIYGKGNNNYFVSTPALTSSYDF